MAKKAAKKRAPKKATRRAAKNPFSASAGVGEASQAAGTGRKSNDAARRRYAKGRRKVKPGRTAGDLIYGRGGQAAASTRAGRQRTTRILANVRLANKPNLSKTAEKKLMYSAKTGNRKSDG